VTGVFQSHSFAATGPNCSSSVAFGDFNGDGKADLVVGKFGGDWAFATDFSVLWATAMAPFRPLSTLVRVSIHSP